MSAMKYSTSNSFSVPHLIFFITAGALFLLAAGMIYFRKNINSPFIAARPQPTVTLSTSPTATPLPSPTYTPTPSPTTTVSSDAAVQARAAYTAKDYTKAITLYTRAIAEIKGTVGAGQLELELGNTYRDNKQSDLALTTYASAVAADAHLVAAYQAKANLLISLNRKDEAATALQAGIDANPGNQDLERDLSVLQLSGPNDY